MSIALLVPDDSKSLISVSKLRAADNEVLFGKDLEISTKNGTIGQIEEPENLIRWKTVNITCSENCNLASEDWLILWHKRLGHNKIEDLLKLEDNGI